MGDALQVLKITLGNGCVRRSMILLIDFDGHEDRLQKARSRIPQELSNRVFVLGVWTEPERLKPRLGSYETIGEGMAKDCRERTNDYWGDDLLRHNAEELDRLREYVVPTVLFPLPN